MTNRFNKFALATTGLVALSFGATAATAAPASTSGSTSAKVLQQLTIVKNTDLDFGTIVGGTAPATIAVSASGTPTCGTGLTCTGTTAGAKFTIAGTKNQLVKVTMPTSVALGNGSVTMTATLDQVPTLNLGGTGTAALAFGGSLAVGAGQADGAYTALFTVTVDYQ